MEYWNNGTWWGGVDVVNNESTTAFWNNGVMEGDLFITSTTFKPFFFFI